MFEARCKVRNLCRRFGAALTLGAMLVAASACGGGSKPTVPPASPAATATAGVDPHDVPITTYKSVSGLYTIDVPPGWKTLGIGATQEETFQDWSGALLLAEVGITCEPVISRDGKQWTANDYAERDVGFLKALGSSVKGAEDGRFDLTVDSTPAVEVAYHAVFAGITVRQIGVYVIKGSCAWIIHLRVFRGDPEFYGVVFSRMVNAFRAK